MSKSITSQQHPDFKHVVQAVSYEIWDAISMIPYDENEPEHVRVDEGIKEKVDEVLSFLVGLGYSIIPPPKP